MPLPLPLPLPPTYTHPNPLTTLALHLLPHLPHSLPLLRRIQYHIATPTARILATFPPTPSTSPNQPSAAPPSFAALWIDRARAPETECWLFSTYELPHTHHDEAEAKPQLLSLLNAISYLLPPTPRRPDDQSVILGTVNECLLPLLAGSELQHLVPRKVLTNSIEEARDACVIPSERERDGMGVLGGLSVPYMKWVIAPPSPCPSTSKANEGRREMEEEEEEEEMVLPLGYTYDKVRAERGECRLPILRSDIPRTEKTLSQLGSVGIRYTAPSANTTSNPSAEIDTAEKERKNEDGELIAWAFLGVDGSLTSLHVEPEHRGKGLAKAASKRLFKQLAEDPVAVGFRPVEGLEGGSRDEAWAHSDVAVDNLGSTGVAKGLGGREGWLVRWVSVDLGRVKSVVGGMNK